MAGIEAIRGKKRRRNDDGDQEMTRNEIEAALKECILRLGYEALKTEQGVPLFHLLRETMCSFVFLLALVNPSVTFAFPAFLIF